MALMIDGLFYGAEPQPKNARPYTSAVIAAFDWLFGRLALARSRAQLLEMDDRMLADIGLDRATAKTEGQRGFWG
jgi:uncharacterized protein YjiS (DUF1127 family)